MRFVLSDGTNVVVNDDDLPQVYETLWEMGNEPGAVSAAAIVLNSKVEVRLVGHVDLASRESEAFSRAVARLAKPS